MATLGDKIEGFVKLQTCVMVIKTSSACKHFKQREINPIPGIDIGDKDDEV